MTRERSKAEQSIDVRPERPRAPAAPLPVSRWAVSLRWIDPPANVAGEEVLVVQAIGEDAAKIVALAELEERRGVTDPGNVRILRVERLRS